MAEELVNVRYMVDDVDAAVASTRPTLASLSDRAAPRRSRTWSAATCGYYSAALRVRPGGRRSTVFGLRLARMTWPSLTQPSTRDAGRASALSVPEEVPRPRIKGHGARADRSDVRNGQRETSVWKWITWN